MNGSKTKKFIVLVMNEKQTRDSSLIQSKGTKTIYINSTRIIYKYWLKFIYVKDEYLKKYI